MMTSDRLNTERGNCRATRYRGASLTRGNGNASHTRATLALRYPRWHSAPSRLGREIRSGGSVSPFRFVVEADLEAGDGVSARAAIRSIVAAPFHGRSSSSLVDNEIVDAGEHIAGEIISPPWPELQNRLLLSKVIFQPGESSMVYL
jgi:hypothetical protein